MNVSQAETSGKTYGLMGLARGQTRRPQPAAGKLLSYPSVLLSELLLFLGLLLLLLVIAAFASPQLGAPINVAAPDNPAPVPWFTADISELNLRFNPVFAGIIIPSLWVVGMLAVPFIAPNPAGPGTWFGGRSLGFALAGAVCFGGFLALYVIFDPAGRLFHEINSSLNLTQLANGQSPSWWPTDILFFGFPDLTELSSLLWAGLLPFVILVIVGFAAVLVGRLGVNANRHELTVLIFSGVWAGAFVLMFIYGAMRGPDLILYAPWDVPAILPATFGAG